MKLTDTAAGLDAMDIVAGGARPPRTGLHGMVAGGCLVLLTLLPVPSAVAAAPQYRFETTRSPADGYAQPGEKVAFTTRLLENGRPVDLPFQAVLHAEGSDPVKQQATGSVTMEGVAPGGGFVYFTAVFTPQGGRRTRPWSVSVASAPEKIRPALAEPDDFDRVWQQARAELAAVPTNPTVQPVPVTDEEYRDKVECFEVRLDAPGPRRAFGYLCRPKNADGKKLPALIRFDGAGVYRHEPPHDLAADGFLALSLNAHGIDHGDEATEEQMMAAVKSGPYYTSAGWETLETSPFYFMIIRGLRGLEYLKSRPEWDGTHLITYGASQGGAQSLAVAGLSPEVTFCYAGVPGLCNHGGMEKLQVRGWPGNFPWNDKTKTTAGYLDNCHFATRIKCPVLVSAAWQDHLTRPSSIYAAYNLMSGPKEIIPYPADGHGSAIAQDRATARRRILEHAGAGKEP
jgi:cephalosporin-C deacetylase